MSREPKPEAGVANAEARFQMSRPFARYFVGGLNPHQRAVVQAMLFNAALNAIDAWEKARPVRMKDAFYGGADV